MAIFRITKVYDAQRNSKEEYQNHKEDDEYTQIKEHLLQHGDQEGQLMDNPQEKE